MESLGCRTTEALGWVGLNPYPKWDPRYGGDTKLWLSVETRDFLEPFILRGLCRCRHSSPVETLGTLGPRRPETDFVDLVFSLRVYRGDSG